MSLTKSKLLLVTDDLMLVKRVQEFTKSQNVELALYDPESWTGKNVMDVLPSGNLQIQGDGVLSELPRDKSQGQVLTFPRGMKAQKACSISSAEKSTIENALVACQGNFTEAAKILGIGRATLYRKIRQYHLESQAKSSRMKKAS